MKLNPQQVRLWSGVREVLRVHGVLERNINEPREGTSHTRDGIAPDRERSLEAHRKDSSAQQIHLESDKQMLALFKTLKQAFTWMDECEKVF